MAKKERRGISPEIVAALIGVAGTIIVAVFFNQPQQTTSPDPVVVTATADVASPEEPAPTDPPEANSPEMLAVAVGQDWAQGCISSLWEPYPDAVGAVDMGDGCLQEPVHVFSADGGRLSFVGQRNGDGPVEDYGMFAPLPEAGSVSLIISLDEMNNADLWIGVFPEPDIRSDGLLFVIPAGNVRKRSIEQKDAFTYETLSFASNVDQGSGFSFTFTFDNQSATGEINPFIFKTNPMSIPAASKWVYIGYRGFGGSYSIEGSFSNLFIQ